MEYTKFKKILNTSVFGASKKELMLKIADTPNRYVGLFRPSKPKAKLIQNLLQSYEIKFGNAIESIITEYIKEGGYNLMPINIEHMQADILVEKDKKVILIEQKIRDDHDSAKKRGQIENFTMKLDTLIEKYAEENIVGILYFVDAAFQKNRKFYQKEINRITKDYGIKVLLCYGKDLFDELNMPEKWEELLKHLKRWREQIPELPEINFDSEPEDSFNQMKDIPPSKWRKILYNEGIVKEIFPIIFPRKVTLGKLKHFFETKESKIYKTLSDRISYIMNLI